MKLFTLICLAFTGILAMAAEVSAPRKVTVCVPRYRNEYGSFLVNEAQSRGFFREHGLEVTIESIKSSGQRIENGRIQRPSHADYKVATFVGGSKPKCEFGVSNIERFVGDDKAKDNVVPILVANYGQGYDTDLVTASHSKIHSVKDLKGKAILIGQIPTYVSVMALLKENGVSPKDLVVIHGVHTAPTRLQSLERGELAALTAYLPTMSYFLASNRVRVLEANVVSRYLGDRVPHSVVIVNKSFAQNSAGAVEAFHAAMKESSDYFARNPMEFFRVYIQRDATPEDVKLLDKSLMEKASTFIGKVAFTDTFDRSDANKPQLAALDCDVRRYSNQLVSRGYLAHATDLTEWLGAPAEKGACKLN